MSNTASRLITLIMLLQRRPNQKASELAEELGVSVRSLHRYINTLDDMGIPVYSERGPYGGFSLVRGYKMPPLVFTPEEATALYLGTSLVGEVWGALYADAARGALAKLDNVLPDEQRDEVTWARRSFIVTGMHRASQDPLAGYLEQLRHAIHERQQVELCYQASRRPEALSRTVDPYLLAHRWGWWYVIGYCHLREALRSFRVDRILDLTSLDTAFEMPPDFDVQAYFATERQEQATTRVRMRFAPEWVGIARNNRHMWETMTEEADGSMLVIFHTTDLDWTAGLALAYAGRAVVLEPPELRARVCERIRAVAEQYGVDL